jgi:putative SOS response-associated peptidase YedK
VRTISTFPEKANCRGALFHFSSVSGEEDWNPLYNIAPTQPIPIIRQNPKKPVRELSLLRWGLIPSWAKESSGAAKMINARSETAATKPAFRDALKFRRCLIPADGFYEWQKTGKEKQPYCFEVADGELFAFAGIWDHWRDPNSGKVQRDFIQREICVLDLLSEHDVAVAIVARERSASVGTYGELPDLKFLGGNSHVVVLNDRDFVQKPIRSAVLGNVLGAVGVENVRVDLASIPVFAAGELREVAFAESLRGHGACLFLVKKAERGFHG